jgi:hypothetical protein
MGIAMQSLMLKIQQQTSNNNKNKTCGNMSNKNRKEKKRLCNNAIAFNHLLEDVTAWPFESGD